MVGTPRLGLQFLSAGQAQKEVTVNSSLSALDIMVACAVEEPARSAPPPAPVVGACYLVSSDPTGAWAGKSQCVACFMSGGWQFVQPTAGFRAYVRSVGSFAVYRDGQWELGVIRGAAVVLGGQQVVGERGPAIATPAGGAVIDLEARAALESMLSVLRQHGLIET